MTAAGLAEAVLRVTPPVGLVLAALLTVIGVGSAVWAVADLFMAIFGRGRR